MKMFPDSSAVQRAERRLEQSKQRLREHGSVLASPLGLLAVTGVGAVIGIFLTQRKTSTISSVGTSPLQTLLLTLLIRFVTRRIAHDAKT